MLASRRATSNALPSASNVRVWVTSTRPFWTAIPKRPMRPTSEETFHVSPVRSRARTAPTNASGRVARMTRASAPTVGDVCSLALYPAMSSHRAVPPETRRALGIGDGLVRLSIGIEDANDLIEDVDRAMSRARD